MIKRYMGFGISFILTLGMFVLGTAFHKLETVAVAVQGDTQVLNLTEETSKTGLTMYLFMFALTIVAGYIGRRARGSLLSAGISFGLGLFRTIASLAIISVGPSIIMFESKGLQFMQLGLVLVAIVSTITFAKKN